MSARGMGPRPGGKAADNKAVNFRATVGRLAHFARPDRFKLLALAAIAVVSISLNTLGPKLLGDATNIVFDGVISKMLPAGATKEQVMAQLRAQGKEQMADMLSAMSVHPGTGIDFTALRNAALVVVAVYALAAALQWVYQSALNRIINRVGATLRAEAAQKIDNLSIKYLDSSKRGDLLSRVTNDVDNLVMVLNQALSSVFTSLFTVVFVLSIMVWISWLLALVALVTVPLAALISAFFARRAKPYFTEQWAATGEISAMVEESFSGHAVLTAYDAGEQFTREFKTGNDKLRRAAYGSQFVSGIIQPVINFLSNLNYLIVAVGGGIMVAHGNMTIGGVQAFIQYSRQFSQPIAQIASMATMIQSGAASAERIFELLDSPEQAGDPEPGAAVCRPVRGEICFEDVDFSYSSDTPLIQGLNLRVEPGTSVAIVGPTGAGKTTLVNLIMRFYELDGGRITLDGVDIAAMKRDDLRANIAMVLQDTWLREGTISSNIAFGREGATEEDVRLAAREAGIDRLIRTLPNGYDTRIGASQRDLSAGEKQLLTIARAFISQSPIIILDEATSSVDTRTEMAVSRAMDKLRAGKTSFIIAHRLSTIRDADTILVMDAGAVVEQGSHSELMAARGAYYRLQAAQFGS